MYLITSHTVKIKAAVELIGPLHIQAFILGRTIPIVFQ